MTVNHSEGFGYEPGAQGTRQKEREMMMEEVRLRLKAMSAVSMRLTRRRLARSYSSGTC